MSYSISVHRNGYFTERAGSGDQAGSVTHVGDKESVGGIWEKASTTFTNLQPLHDQVKMNIKTDLYKSKDDAQPFANRSSHRSLLRHEISMRTIRTFEENNVLAKQQHSYKKPVYESAFSDSE